MLSGPYATQNALLIESIYYPMLIIAALGEHWGCRREGAGGITVLLGCIEDVAFREASVKEGSSRTIGTLNGGG